MVWPHNEAGLWPHHVYGFCRSPNGTLLAVTEGRMKPSDTDPHHLLLKRSTDDGETWSDNHMLEESQDGECWANMSPVVDYRRGRVWIFYALNFKNESTRVFCRWSDDDGTTWSERRDMTDLVHGNDDNGWTFFFPGPGHGIQLAAQADPSRNGRLVVSFWNRREIGASPRRYGISVIYMDEPQGDAAHRGWRFGGVTPARLSDGTIHGMNEASVAELPDGRLLFHGRGGNGTPTARKRVFAYSEDGGQSVGEVRVSDEFSFSGCQGATIGHDGALYFSHPNDPDSRRNLTVSISHDHGRSWVDHHQITDSGAMYSDMAMLPSSKLCLLHGSDFAGHRAFPREVRLKRFAIERQ